MSRFCVNCGAELGKDAKFCTKCGSKVESEVKNIDAAPAVKGKKNKKVAVIAVAAVIILAVTIIFVTLIQPMLNYNSAMEIFIKGNYEEAKAAFTELGDYKDSYEMITECDYRIATELYDKAEYEEAISAFAALNGYSDSDYMIADCEYVMAVEKMKAGDYSGAIPYFEKIADHKDSEKLLTECKNIISEEKYQNALSLLEEGKLDESLKVFGEIKDYKDSGDHIETIKKEQKYQKALGLMDEAKYKEALEIFKEIEDYKDSAKKIKTCNNKINGSSSSGKSSSGAFKVERSKTEIDQGVVKKEYRVTCKNCGATQHITINFGTYQSSVGKEIKCKTCLKKGYVTFS